MKKAPSNITNACFTDTLFTQSALPASQSVLGVSSAQLLALPCFLASVVGAREVLEQHFGEEFEDKDFNCLEEWYAVSGTLEAHDNKHQTNWSTVMYQKVLTDLYLKLVEDGVKRLNAYHDKFASQWLNEIPCNNRNLKLSNQQLRISIGLRLGTKICEPHLCSCRKKVEALLFKEFR